jgi:uncharacterized repeat protein (TIGR01451 family)/CSLREA domain-containing protein
MKLLPITNRRALLTEPTRSSLRLSVCLLALVGTVFFARMWFGTATVAGSQKASSAQVNASLSRAATIHFEHAGSQRINLSEGRDLLTSYEGNEEAVKALTGNAATPLANASDDFDEDGVPDLVCAYASPEGGYLTLHRGNVDAIYPYTPEAHERRAQNRFTEAPFLSPAHLFETPAAANLIGAGDFNADDHRDLITAQIGDHALWFFAGDGQGGFAEARRLGLYGQVTALEAGEINRRDGLTDIIVGIAGASGAKVLVLESPSGAINAEPEVFELPEPVAALALGDIVGDYEQDLAIAAGNQLLVVSGRDRKLSYGNSIESPVEAAKVSRQSFNFNIKSIAIGHFRGANSTDIAMLGDDGRVRINRNPTPAPSKQRKSSLAGWRTKILETEPWPLASRLVRARLSSNPTDSLLVLDTQSQRLNIIDQQPEVMSKTLSSATPAPSAGGLMVSSLVSDGEVTAVLPMRLRSHALSDLVVLSRERPAPVVVYSVSSTFTVNSTLDTSDATPGNGICNDGSGNCTLRAAIQEANAFAGADIINFSIGAGAVTISLGFVLPQITETLSLDATTQPGFAGSPLVEVSGGGVSPGQDGFVIQANNCVVRGFVINRFSGVGSGISMISSSSIIEGNFLGTDVNGTGALANGVGVSIVAGTGNTIGGTAGAARNLMSGNNDAGIVIGTGGNVVVGNFVGTDAAGGAALGNGLEGIRVGDVPNNTIGGTAPGARNVISGNGTNGVRFNSVGGGAGNLIQGNHIGTNAAGTTAIPNTFGIIINGASNNTIGGTTASARNLISGNSVNGLVIQLAGATGNAIQGNFIGTDITGTSSLGNANFGVSINNLAASTTIGGTVAGARNVISGNGGDGITIDASSNIVQGNFLGTNASGTAAVANIGSGILIFTGSGNIVGGTSAAARNISSGNGFNGITIQPGPANNNTIQGNFVGLDVSGTTAIANGFSGIVVSGTNNLIGGTAAGARNVCSGNVLTGIHMLMNTATNNTVQGNFAGTNAAGTAAVPNNRDGMRINGGLNNLVGGTAAGAGNVVSGNPIGFTFLNSGNGNTVQGNFIGTQINGTTPLPNTGDGINIDTTSSNNTIGGTVANARNIIAFNGGRGINALSGTGNGFLTNSIFSNTSLGIDLNGDGVTANDAGDPDTGPNNLQNFPVLTSATPGAMTTIQGTLNSTASTAFRIEFFSNPTCDASGNGEGTTFLGFTNVTTNASGNATINVTLPVSVAAGNVIVATATDPANNTSEFSACVTVMVPAATADLLITKTDTPDPVIAGANLTYTINLTNNGPDVATTVMMQDTLPAGTTFVSVASPGSCTTPPVGGTGTVTCTLASLASGSSATITLVVNVTAPAGSTITNTATVSNSTPDPSPGNNSATAMTAVNAPVACAINCPPNQAVSNTPNQCGATVNYPPPTTTGPCGAVTCTPAAGSFFPRGATLVNCTTGAGPSCSFTVTVNDTQAPAITCPPNQDVNSPGPTPVTYPPPTVTDNCPGPTSNCVPPSGSTFPLGATLVNCTATDASSNTANCSFTVTVTTACTISCPPNQTVNTSQCNATISYPAPTTAGACGAVKCSPTSGATLPLGTTTVTCRTDAGPSCSFTVRVVDNRPPEVTCPANISKPTDPGRTIAVINYAPATVSDNCAGATVVCLPASGFTAPVGITTVTCTARDAANNIASCSFTVTVSDAEPPTIQCPANVSVDVGTGQTSGVVLYAAPVANDNVPGASVVCAPPSGATFPVGLTTVTCTARDSGGNQTGCSFSVTVTGGAPTGRVIIPGGGPALEFGSASPVPVGRKPAKKKNLPCGLFSIHNSAFTPLRLTLASINRVVADTDTGRISQPAEGEVYELSEILADGSLVPLAVGSTVSVAVGAQRNFCLKFAPSIPALAGVTTGLRAPQAIPDVVNSRVIFTVAGGASLIANVNARVETALKLINPNNPRKPGIVSLSSSGNEFIVNFIVFDSNMDVNKASYEFLNASGNTVAGPFDIDLVQAIREKNLVRGQSFTVEQRFTGARSHPEIKGVRVTVFDSETKAVISTSELQPGLANAVQMGQAESPKIIPPRAGMKR